jgi:fucose permease
MSQRDTGGSGPVPALFLLFGSMGATSATIPALIPAVARDRIGEVEEYVRAVPALFLGLLFGVLLASALGHVLTPRALALIGAGTQAAGFGGIAALASPLDFVVLAIVVGVGFGLVEASASVLARAAAGEGTARLLSGLTGTVAIVAAGIPLVVALTPLGRTPTVVFLVVAAVHLLAMAFVRRSVGSDGEQSRPVAPPGAHDARPVSVTVVVAATGAALALYVGVETVYAGWSSTIPLLVLGVSAQQAALGTSVFWALLAAGRYVAAAVLRGTISPLRYLLVSTSVAALALLVTAGTISARPVLATVALAIAVAALGPCYSLILGAALSRIPVTRARRATGLLVACGAGGGSLVPALILAVADSPISAVVFAVTGVLTVMSGALVAIGTRRAVVAEPETAGP